jgi:hypothetical protein
MTKGDAKEMERSSKVLKDEQCWRGLLRPFCLRKRINRG